MIVTRVRNGKTQEYELKAKSTNYNTRKLFRFNDVEYEKFIEKCKKHNQTPSNVVRDLVKLYVEKYTGDGDF